MIVGNLIINVRTLMLVNYIASHCNAIQLIHDYTRITETTKTILDLAFVTKPDKTWFEI